MQGLEQYRSQVSRSQAKAFDKNVAAYADQNDRDYQEFASAVEEGRLEAKPDI